MTPTEFRDRLEAAARRTGLTATDLAVWLGCPRPTVRTWLLGMRKPTPHIGGHVWDRLAQRLIWLEQSDALPVPDATVLATIGAPRRQFLLAARDREKLRSVRPEADNP